MIQIGSQEFSTYQSFKEYYEALKDELVWSSHPDQVQAELFLCEDYEYQITIDRILSEGFDVEAF